MYRGTKPKMAIFPKREKEFNFFSHKKNRRLKFFFSISLNSLNFNFYCFIPIQIRNY